MRIPIDAPRRNFAAGASFQRVVDPNDDRPIGNKGRDQTKEQYPGEITGIPTTAVQDTMKRRKVPGIRQTHCP